MQPEPRTNNGLAGPDYFATTHWTMVLNARNKDSPSSHEALENLCRTYWHPLFAYVRRRGYGLHDAQDLTQEFFGHFLEKHYLKDVAREKGKFRSFLLAYMNHFLANEWDKAKAQKRGGHLQFVSLEGSSHGAGVHYEPATHLPPDKVYEQQWALALLAQVLAAAPAGIHRRRQSGIVRTP